MAVKAADPAAAVDRFFLGMPVTIPDGGTCHIISFGKASVGMMRAALGHVPADQVGRKLIVTNRENAAVVDGVVVLVAGHPVPDAAGAVAAKVVEDIARGAGENDLLLVLVSGGGSALLPAPVDGITLEDKITVNKVLLASGANIQETNLVRQSLSRLKGGGLARMAQPARVQTLVLSDVIGDDLRYVASGPTAERIGSRKDALAVLQTLGVLGQIPNPVRDLLATPDPIESAPARTSLNIVGSNAISLAAMQDVSPTPARIVSGDITQNVEAAAEIIAEHAQNAAKGEALLFGGETTVILRGNGTGGRNQELALRFTLAAARRGITGPWVFLSAGTDGRDGPTDSAGACVDDQTLDRLCQADVDPLTFLANNDSYPVLLASGDHIDKWASGTNVADVQIFIAQNPPSGGGKTR